jgi:hypothetical protein
MIVKLKKYNATMDSVIHCGYFELDPVNIVTFEEENDFKIKKNDCIRISVRSGQSYLISSEDAEKLKSILNYGFKDMIALKMLETTIFADYQFLNASGGYSGSDCLTLTKDQTILMADFEYVFVFDLKLPIKMEKSAIKEIIQSSKLGDFFDIGKEAHEQIFSKFNFIARQQYETKQN